MKKDDYELIFDFKNPNQIINMGGPWIGDLFLKKHIICKSVLIDSQKFYPKEEKLFFVKYHEVSKWRVHNFFTINYWNKKNNQLFESNLKYNVLFIQKGNNEDEIIIYKAFHSENTSLGTIIPLNEIEFTICKRE